MSSWLHYQISYIESDLLISHNSVARKLNAEELVMSSCQCGRSCQSNPIATLWLNGRSSTIQPFSSLFPVLVVLFPWFLNKTTSLNTKQKRIPFWAFSWLFLNMSLFAAAGAVSLKSMTLASWRLLLYTNIMPPPPIPDECMLTTPKQNMAAMAASTAEPLALRMSFPIWEH